MATTDTKLSHQGEYEALREEIMLYQQEMHRTWLWAIIPAGAVYTWLASRMLQTVAQQPQPSTPFPRSVWFIPVVFVLLCGIRYLVFACRINQLARYQCELEEDAFGKEGRLRGIASCNRESLLPMMCVIGACLVWLGLLLCSTYISCTLSQMKPMCLALGAGLVWVILVIYPIYLAYALWRTKPNAGSAGAPPASTS
jgi:hypothetical protein